MSKRPMIEGFNPFVQAATVARISALSGAEYKPLWEVVGKHKDKHGDSLPVYRKVSIKKGKYMPHQGKQEMARRVVGGMKHGA